MIKRLRITLQRAFPVLVLLAVANVWAAAQQNRRGAPDAIHFEPGHTKAVLKGALLRGRTKHAYVLRAKAGQTLTLHLTSTADAVIINDILGPDKKSAIPPDVGEDFWTDWTVEPTKAGDYFISVITTEIAKRINRYTLEVSLK